MYIWVPRIDGGVGHLVIFVNVVGIIRRVVDARTVARVAHNARMQRTRMSGRTNPAWFSIVRSQVLVRRCLTHFCVVLLLVSRKNLGFFPKTHQHTFFLYFFSLTCFIILSQAFFFLSFYFSSIFRLMIDKYKS